MNKAFTSQADDWTPAITTVQQRLLCLAKLLHHFGNLPNFKKISVA